MEMNDFETSFLASSPQVAPLPFGWPCRAGPGRLAVCFSVLILNNASALRAGKNCYMMDPSQDACSKNQNVIWTVTFAILERPLKSVNLVKWLIKTAISSAVGLTYPYD